MAIEGIAIRGGKVYTAEPDGNTVVVNGIRSKAAPGTLMGARIAVAPDGTIAVVARIGSGPGQDVGYGCILGGDWKVHGPTAQNQCVVWEDNTFLAARMGPGGTTLVRHAIDGRVIATGPATTRQGILYYDFLSKQFVEQLQQVVTVEGIQLINAIRRKLGDGRIIWCGQKVGTPDVLYVAGDRISFVAGPQPKYPMCEVEGASIVVNGGVRFDPPYKGVVVGPGNPPPPPPPPEEPPVAVPNYSAYVEKRATELGLKQVNGGNNDATRERTFEILNQIAAELHDQDPGIGLLEKTSGNRWRDRAIDILTWMEQSGVCHHFDVIADGEGADGDPAPVWQDKGLINASRWREPYEVGGIPNPPPPPPPPVDPPPPPPVDPPPPSGIVATLERIEAKLDKVAADAAAALYEAKQASLNSLQAVDNDKQPRETVASGRILGMGITLRGIVEGVDE